MITVGGAGAIGGTTGAARARAGESVANITGGFIEVKQHHRSLGIYGTEVGRVEDHDPPAHYFGVPAVAARTADELAKAPHDALDADHPTVIEARVDPAHYRETVYD